MTNTSKVLSFIGDDHLVECYMIATELELDKDFIVQLRNELSHRKLMLNQSERNLLSVCTALEIEASGYKL